MNVAGVGLGVVEQFLNTLDLRTFTRHGENHVSTDTLTSPEALSAWLEAHNLASGQQNLRPDDLDTAVSLRIALREALTDNTDSTDGAGVTQVLARFPLHLAADPSGQLRLTADSGVAGLDAIIETVAVSVATGNWHRLKLCASPDCHWAFYDTSRSGAGRWCSMEVCGNRHKTRAYRRRRTE